MTSANTIIWINIYGTHSTWVRSNNKKKKTTTKYTNKTNNQTNFHIHRYYGTLSHTHTHLLIEILSSQFTFRFHFHSSFDCLGMGECDPECREIGENIMFTNDRLPMKGKWWKQSERKSAHTKNGPLCKDFEKETRFKSSRKLLAPTLSHTATKLYHISAKWVKKSQIFIEGGGEEKDRKGCE